MVDKIRLLGKNFTIKHMTGKELTNEVNSFQRLNGYIDYNQAIIYLANDMDIQSQHSTLIHEVLHGLFQDLAEDWIEEAELKIYAFIKDNPQFIKEVIECN
jgi:Zn-dependent peptidase ImmA (M78 family)